MTVRRLPLAEMADVVSGITKGRRTRDPTIRVPYLRVANVQAGHLRLHDIKEIDATTEEIERYRLRNQDVLMTEGGDPDKLGRGALWGDQIATCIHQNHIFRVRLNTSLIEPRYFVRFLASKPAVTYFVKAAKQTTGIATINRTQLGALPVPLPSIHEQRRIADILDKADTIRRKSKEAIALTEELLRSAFLEMFGDPVANTKGWPVKSLGELLEAIDSGWSPVCDARPAAMGEWGVLKLGAVTFGRYDEQETKALGAHLSPLPELEVKAGDVLFSRKNTYEHVAACVFVTSTRPRLLLPDLIFRLVLSRTSGLLPEVLWGLLSDPRKRKQVQGLAGGTAGSMPNISKERLKGVTVPIAPLPLQKKFASALRRNEGLRVALEAAAAESDELFNSLVAGAFSGPLEPPC